MAGVAGPMLRRSRTDFARFFLGLAVGTVTGTGLLALIVGLAGQLLASGVPLPRRLRLACAFAAGPRGAVTLDPDGGQALVTRFDCPSRLRMLLVLVLHGWIKRDVRRVASGYLGAVTVRDWRSRTVLSISLWQRLEHVYGMGGVNRHIRASR